ncbi:GNAT family N-acetyltransferase [Nocardioides sp. GCM10027113]|uniref:GNAT family N-acetyltransferase n=1 Tax=unclassified Nocardioides TaxID=2615069 RepID=UPI0036206BA4
MTRSLTLPVDLAGTYTVRPLAHGDEAAVTAVIAAQDLADTGEVAIEEADIVADWQRPGYDVSENSVGIFAGDTLVAFADVSTSTRGDAAVVPDHRGRGLGTALARWMRERAAEHGWTEVGMPVPQGSGGDRLLEALGYHVRWTSWVLELPEGASIPDRPLPEGYAVGEADPTRYEQCYAVQEDAFLEWTSRERDTFEQWRSATIDRPGFEPWNLRAVTDPAGDVVAMCFVLKAGDEGYVDRLATRRDQRGKGLAQALLVDAFRVAREHGAPRAGLSTDSRTGALALYEKVGMKVTSTWVNRAISLDGALDGHR